MKQRPSAIAVALLAVRSVLRPTARLFAVMSIAAGLVQAGFAVVLWETGTMGLASGLVCFLLGTVGLVVIDPRLLSAAHCQF